jgi:hypothetical protein
MISTDKTKLDNSTDQSTASTLVQRDASGNASFVQVLYDNAAKTQHIALQAPSALSSTYTLTMPANTGTNGYVLTTDGVGVTSWTLPSTGFSDPMTTAGDMIYRNSSNVTTRLPTGSVGNTLQIDTSGNVVWAYNNSKTVISLFDDFRGGVIPYGDGNWGYTLSGTGNIVLSAVTSGNWIGAIDVQRGTTVAGYAVVKKANGVRLSAGSLTSEFTIRTDANLPTSGQNYNVRVGFADSGVGGSNPTNGLWFLINQANTPNFVINSRAGGTTTTVITSSAYAVSTWYTLRIDVNSAGTLVTFYVNGVSVGTTSTNIPTSTQPIAPFAQIESVAGIQNRVVTLDYFSYTHVLTSARY